MVVVPGLEVVGGARTAKNEFNVNSPLGLHMQVHDGG